MAMSGKILRVLLADDERPARRFLTTLLKRCADVDIVGEAATGREALEMIEQRKPDLALLDLQMPELGGLEVTRLLKAGAAPMIAFVTAFDEFAVQAFELNAVDYLLKPVEQARLEETLARARLRARADHGERVRQLQNAAAAADTATRRAYLERIPVRRRDEVVILPVRQIVAIVAEGELLHITTAHTERYTITYRLHAIESKLDPKRFVRLGRGTLAAIDMIQRVSPMPGGTYQVTMTNGQQLQVSRLQSRVLRETLLRL
jgi:two-component system LytT family response regulator